MTRGVEQELLAAVDAIRDVLDVVVGWSRPLTEAEKLELIKQLCEDALRELA